VRDLLVKGVVADRTIKFLFGFDPAKLVLGGIGDALKGTLGGFLQKGGSPANPLFVVDISGGAGGVGGAAGGAAGGIGSKIASVLPVATIVASAAAVAVTWLKVNDNSTRQAKGLALQLDDGIRVKTPAELQHALDGVNQGIHDISSNPLNVLVSGEALTTLNDMKAKLTAAISNQKGGRDVALPGGKTAMQDTYHPKGQGGIGLMSGGPSSWSAAAARTNDDISDIKRNISHLKDLRDDFRSQGDTHSARKITGKIADMKDRLAAAQASSTRANAAAVQKNAASTAAAIARNKPIITTIVSTIVNVAAGTVTKSITSQSRVGKAGGSSSSGGMSPYFKNQS